MQVSFPGHISRPQLTHGYRIRKVKCDEGRPACERCVTTGRVCDGYGIWGGGGNSYGNRQCLVSKDGSAAPHLSMPFSVLSSGTDEEKGYFEVGNLDSSFLPFYHCQS